MKNRFIISISFLLILNVLTGCSTKNDSNENLKEAKKEVATKINALKSKVTKEKNWNDVTKKFQELELKRKETLEAINEKKSTSNTK